MMLSSSYFLTRRKEVEDVITTYWSMNAIPLLSKLLNMRMIRRVIIVIWDPNPKGAKEKIGEHKSSSK